MSVTLNFGWPLPKDREQLLEILVRERLSTLTPMTSPPPRRPLAASAYHDANQSIPNTAWTTLALNSESVDTQGCTTTRRTTPE